MSVPALASLLIPRSFDEGCTEMNIDKIVKLLRKCEVFSELADKEIKSIAKLCKIEKFNAGDSIYSQGNLGEKLYILADGEVTLERTIDIGDQRRAKIPVFTFRATPSRGLMGGWFALVGGQHRHMCTAVCYRATTLISVECSRLREYIEKNLEIKAKILEKLILLLRDRIDSSYKAMETL
jgi:CRP/FNR family cyclic AMP-dependent transcriptional regulator